MTASGGDRLKRLRDLVARLELLPASAERDRVLGEVRARAVDVDTGETPRAMLPQDPVAPMVQLLESHRSVATPRPPRPPRRAPAPPPPVAPRPQLPAMEPLPREAGEPVDLLWSDDRPPLEDLPNPWGDTSRGPAVRPWTRGLRG